ncbi:MAG: hypothetical protein MUC83_06245 [Pirellula sp.]|nr:hypothetical protein [Pirellula sp.]
MASIENNRLEPFLKFLEDRDFGGAAASLCVDRNSPGYAIDSTIQIAMMLEVDVSVLELPASIGKPLSASAEARSIINERALVLVRQRMLQNLVRNSTSPEEAEKLLGDVTEEFSRTASVSPKPTSLAIEGVDPQLARIVSLLHGPIPLVVNPAPQPTIGDTTSPTVKSEKISVADQRSVLVYRLGKLASLGFGLFAIVGVALLGYSYSTHSPPAPFSMSEGLSLTEQEAIMNVWTERNIPKTMRWFISTVADDFFPVRFEPGLPLAYAGEEWTWDKKISSINKSIDEIVSRFKRCHEEIFVLYLIAIILTLLHWYNRDIISGIMMVLLGLMGVPFLMYQARRMSFDITLWLWPLLIPGLIALIASACDLLYVTPKTNRRKELRAFWLGALAFIVGGLFLAWAISEGTYLKPASGLGIVGGAWLMAVHGWKYLRSKDKRKRFNCGGGQTEVGTRVESCEKLRVKVVASGPKSVDIHWYDEQNKVLSKLPSKLSDACSAWIASRMPKILKRCSSLNATTSKGCTV